MLVYDPVADRKWYFLCNSWLSIDVGDCVLDKVFPVATEQDRKQFRYFPSVFFQHICLPVFLILGKWPHSPDILMKAHSNQWPGHVRVCDTDGPNVLLECGHERDIHPVRQKSVPGSEDIETVTCIT